MFASWGIETRTVEPFDTRYPHSNKLRQLESAAIHAADYVVLCDCDTVFCADISPWIVGNSIRARTPSYAGLTTRQWERLFRRANLNPPTLRIKSLLDGRDTLPIYCNGALLIIPQRTLQSLRPVWPKWARWLSDLPELLGPLDTYIDQISFTLSCAELNLTIDQLPAELNFPVRISPSGKLYRAGAGTSFSPLVLHHHRRTPAGFLTMTATSCLNRQIRRINRLIRSIRRSTFQKPDAFREDAMEHRVRERLSVRTPPRALAWRHNR